MTPFYFGEWDTRLFGAYDPPAGADRRAGVVICHPVGPEYYRAYSASRFLAGVLSSSGLHVLRFDYQGTGDSAGELAGVVPTDWLSNIDEAVEELEAMADLRAVGLLGLRFGALLASLAADRRSDVDRLVLWDPVFSGRDCLEALESLTTRGVGAAAGAGSTPFELMSDLYTGAFLEALKALSPPGGASALPPTLIVSTVPDQDAYDDVERDLTQAGAACAVAHRPGPCVWDQRRDYVNTGMPVEAVTEISRWMISTP